MQRRQTTIVRALALALGSVPMSIACLPAAAQTYDYVGQITLFPYNFCPAGWTETSGQIVSIAEYEVLFYLIGTTYGGDGTSTFALPDQRGRSTLGQSGSYLLGQKAGQETTTVTTAQLPSHNHNILATNEQVNKGGPGNKLLAADSSRNKYSDTANPPNVDMNAQMMATSGGNQPTEVRDPILSLRWCISNYGIYPSQN